MASARTKDDPVRTILGRFNWDERGLPVDKPFLMSQWNGGELQFVYPTNEFEDLDHGLSEAAASETARRPGRAHSGRPFPFSHGREGAMLEVKGLCKYFGGIRAVDDCSSRSRPARITALIGPNGAGKTTAFNCISRTITAHEGRGLARRQAHRPAAPAQDHRDGA
jgi:ABC-type glutathione transport system ATPase component